MTKKIDALINGVSAKTLKEFCVAKASTTGGCAEFLPVPDGGIKKSSSDRDIFPRGSHKRFESVEEVGYFKHLGMLVFFVKLHPGHELSERSCRRLQFDFACNLLKCADWTHQSTFTDWLSKKGVMVPKVSEGLFVFADSGGNFRFSYIQNIKPAADKGLLRYRRFTFYVTAQNDRSNRTFIDRMKMPWPDMASLSGAFSVQALSDEFFGEYKRIYEKFVAFCMKPSVKKQFTDRGFSDDKFMRDYVKKLMGRLVFLHFLEKKLWLGVPEGAKWGEGDANYLRNLFNAKKIQKAFKDDFLDKVLEPLFFGSLNEKRKGDVADAILSPDKAEKVRIPYLNGGLFEGDFDRADGHKGIDSTSIPFPDDYFEDLFDTFDRFNFTIDENGPEDAEVGVDPEMLSRIFENLLEDNKDKGAFYTPKEIVDYMCKESLIAYLGETPAVRDIVENYSSNDSLEEKFTYEEKTGLIEKLSKVKICDPAIGSGAFPMGMLAILARLRLRLENKEETSANIVALKKEIIQNNIYGVDIEAGAVDIARLRFWLSIVVDEEEPIPLPNLDYKIMQGNSLLESYGGIDLSHVLAGGGTTVKTRGKNKGKKKKEFWQAEFAFDAKSAVDEIVRDKDQLFSTTDHEVKAKLVARINRNVKEYISHKLPADSPYAATIPDGPNPNFMLWHLYFSEVFNEGGFDIVIGNPPYIKELDNAHVFEVVNKSDFGKKYHHGKMDYWFYFLHKAIEVTRTNAIINFITSRYWLKSSGAEKLLRHIYDELSILQIVDIGGLQVFDQVVGNHMIAIYKKCTTSNCLYRRVAHNVGNIAKHIFCEERTIPRSCLITVRGRTVEVNVEEGFATHILQKMDKLFTSNLFKATQGVVENPRCLNKKNIASIAEMGHDVSSFRVGDEVFVLSSASVEELKLSPKEMQLLRPYHAPNEIHRYWYSDSVGQYLMYLTRDTVKDIDEYPKIKEHLVRFKCFMDQRRETKNGTVKWFHLHWPRKESIFSDAKIVYPQMGAQPVFAYIKEPYFVNMATNIINGAKASELKALVGILNSKAGSFWICNRAKKRGVGYDISVAVINRFPVDKSFLNDNTLIGLVDQILDAKKSNPNADTSALESKIDDLVYDLYGLTKEERAIVDPERFGKTKVEQGGADNEQVQVVASPQDDSDSGDDARD